MRAEWTDCGAYTSGSTAHPGGATRRASGGAAMTSTTASDRHDEHWGNPTKIGKRRRGRGFKSRRPDSNGEPERLADVVHCGVTTSASILKTHGDTRSRVRGARRRTHSEALGGATAERPQLRERPDLPLASSDRQGRFRRSLPRDATPSGCATTASLRQDN